MNRIASRSLIVWILILALLGGTVFFVVEYVSNAGIWFLFPGSPHVYSGNKVGTGTVTDADGLLLLQMEGGRKYSPDVSIRKATLHWVGDRLGNIQVPALGYYANHLVGYDMLNGAYSYGNNGGTMKLTISSKVQTAALEAMGNRAGTVAVYNYRTGEILCALTTPTYDPDNVPDIANDETGAYQGVYVNRFLKSVYVPGSIFKIATTAAALETVPDILTKTFVCTGSFETGDGDVTCESIHGTQNLKDAFCNSCNCAFAQVTALVGKEQMTAYIQRFGLTGKVSFDGNTTGAGNYDVMDASREEFAWSGIGQHTNQINPCTFMIFVGAIAGEGTAAKPYVVSEISNTYRVKTQQTDAVVSQKTARILREFMQNNVDTKYGAQNFPGLTVCAKSGTGEVGGGKKPNAVFTGFVADDQYPLAFIVVVEDGGYGASVCVPILSKVLDACKSSMDGR